MIDRIPSQSRSLERAVLGFGILFIAGPAVIFGLNIEITERFFGAKDVLSQSNIGEIIRPKNVVKKKGNEDSAYGSARQGDPIYVGDTVMTGKESFTRVTLSDGSVLDLGPETLVRIEPVRSFSLKGIKKKLKITVEAGAVKAKTKTNSAPIVIESSSGEILKEIIAPPVVMTTPTPAPPVAAVSGTPVALVTAPAAVAAEDEFFEAVVTAPTPAPADSAPSKKESVIAKIFSTKPESTPKPVATPAATPAAVAGATPATAPPLAATPVDSGPVVPVFDSEIDNPKAEVKPLLSKVVLTVSRPKAIQVLTPAPKGILPDDVELEEQHFILKWKDGGAAVKPPYTLWIEEDGKKDKIVTDQTNVRWNIPLKADGKINWWVEVPLRDEGKVESPKQIASWSFPVPKLASPENKIEVPELFLMGPTRDLVLTWKSSPICAKFEVNASKSADFSTLMLKTDTEKNFQTLKSLEPGTYYWRVACVYRDNFRLFSKARSFTIREPAQPLKAGN